MSQDACPRCFTMNPESAEFCSECGASMRQGSVGSDDEVYADITRANLLRMRGDYKGAQDMCLAVLRRYPNNGTAHTLLGDIAMDQGDLKHAAEWYEMALDLNPESRSDKEKLDRARAALREIEDSSASRQIGLPTKRPTPWPLALFATGVLATVAAGAFLAGKAAQGKDAPQRVIQEPVAVPPPAYDPTTEKPPPRPAESREPEPPSSLRQDSALATGMVGRLPEGAVLLSSLSDPRGPSAVLTIVVEPAQDPATVALQCGIAFLKAFPAYKTVTLRAATDGEAVLVADLSADGAAAAEADLARGGALDTVASAHLTGVWKKGDASEPPPKPE